MSTNGIGFRNIEATTTFDRVFRKDVTDWLRIPRGSETQHFAIMGDTGAGKSALIIPALMQVRRRGESAIVYDPKGTYYEQLGDPNQGDILLNPLDMRCPFYDLADEVTDSSNALTLAASLFPDSPGENPFFLKTVRSLFAYMLLLKPTPGQLVDWLSSEEEIDRLVKGTRHAYKLYSQAGPQRGGVISTLGNVGDALEQLPRDPNGNQRWSTRMWAKDRKGWIFISSQAMQEESLRPLISLWLDLLILRLVNNGSSSTCKTWFVLDELANLQRLPQLQKAITQSRSSNCVMLLAFQGKSQIDALYGPISDAMLSSPATKIFLRTSEFNGADWISKTIGKIKVRRYRETRTMSDSSDSHNSQSQQWETVEESLVMASQISGLDDLSGYLKHGNLVVPLRFPYCELPARNVKFIRRNTDELPAMPQEYEKSAIKQPDQTHYFE